MHSSQNSDQPSQSAPDNYARLHASFQWLVPAQFNIAQACCGRWAVERPGAPVLLADERAKPMLTGLRTESLAGALRLTDVRSEIFGDDVLTRGRVVYPPKLSIDETVFSLG